MRDHHFCRQSNDTGKNVSIGIFSALASAAAVYYFFGTKKEAEKREQIKDFVKDTKDKVIKTGNILQDAASEAYDDLKDLLKDKYQDLKALNEEKHTELAGKIRSRWDLIKKDIEEATNN